MRGGGAERVMLALATAFAERGVGVDLVLVKAEGEYLDMVPEGVRVVDLNSHRTLTAVPRFLRYVRRERPVALMSTLTTSDAASLIAKLIYGRRLRVVVRQANHVHGISQCERFQDPPGVAAGEAADAVGGRHRGGVRGRCG